MIRRLGFLLKQLEWATGGRLTPTVTIILATNTLLFFADLMVFHLFPVPIDPITVDSPIRQALRMQGVLVFGDFQIWRLFTGALLHADIMHLAFNMLGVFFFASLVEKHLGTRRFILLILATLLLGNLVHGLIWPYSPVIGFSGASIAILIAFATIAPTATIILYIFPVPAWFVAVLVVTVDLAGALQPGGQIANLVHLVGAACGFLAVRRPGLLDVGIRLGTRVNDWREERQERHVQRDEAYLDQLLEKVSRQGLTSLSNSERTFLARYGKK